MLFPIGLESYRDCYVADAKPSQTVCIVANGDARALKNGRALFDIPIH